MHRLLAAGILGFLGLLLPALPVSAAGNSTAGAHQQHAVDWGQHDTAVYVVSTLNVLHTRKGQPVVGILTRRFGIARYEVWSDLNNDDLFFVQLKKADGSLVGTLAYQMGWPQPQTLSHGFGKLGIHGAGNSVSDAFKTDPKQLIGSFTSTLPQ